MRKLASFIFLLFVFFLSERKCLAQFQVSSSLILVPSMENNRMPFGVSVGGKYFYTKHSNVGIAFRYVPNMRLVTSTVQAEYIFNVRKLLRPYIGVEGGLYRKFSNQGNEVDISSFGGGLKVGIQYAFLPSLGIDLGFTQHVSEPTFYRYVSESRMINAGIYVKF